MSWRVAKSLQVLLGEINEIAPERSKASDGSIGDAAHASRESDHNPWLKDGSMGVVTARDITHDPQHGCDAGDLAEHFRRMGKAGDPRIKYVIWNRQIASFVENWRWRHYSGTNAHQHHVHVSVQSEKRYYDSEKPWGLLAATVETRPDPKPKPEPSAPPMEEDDDMKSDEQIDLGKWAAAVLRDVDGKVTLEEATAIQTAAAAQTNESVHAMAQTLAAMQETQRAILAELRKTSG